MRHVLVVGAGAGVGFAVARTLAAQGVPVSSLGRSAPAGLNVPHETADVKDADFAGAIAHAEEARAVPVDAVVFVAGDGTFGVTGAIPAERAREVFERNFWAVARAALAAAARWETSGPGTFVAISSIAGRRAVPFESYYAASKAATSRFLGCLDLEGSGRGSRFVALHPGLLRTGFVGKTDWHGIPAPAPSGTDPERVARVVLAVLEGERAPLVIGWRETLTDLADRLAPGLYDAVLRRRAAKVLRGAPPKLPA